MLTVTNYKTRISKEGKEYLTLEIQGGLEMIQSQVTGRFYATVRKSSVTTTFGEDVAKMLHWNPDSRKDSSGRMRCLRVYHPEYR